MGDQEIRTITIAARFDNALEVTLAELRIELTYPRTRMWSGSFAYARGERA